MNVGGFIAPRSFLSLFPSAFRQAHTLMLPHSAKWAELESTSLPPPIALVDEELKMRNN